MRSSEQKRSVTNVTNITHPRVKNHQLCFFQPLLPTFCSLLLYFRYSTCQKTMCLNDKFGGLLRKGGIYYNIYAHTCLRLKNV